VSWPKDKVNAALPLRVTGLDYNDPILSVFGDDWFLKLACPWRAVISAVVLDWEDPRVKDEAWNLIGTCLVSADDGPPGELVFTFDDATFLVGPDVEEDPWVLSLPDFVAVGGLL
jgi:hypothetical protein